MMVVAAVGAVVQAAVAVARAHPRTSHGSTDQLWRGAGCARCRDTGFAGRIGIFELLVPDSRFIDAVARGEPLGTLRSIAVESGLVLLNEDGFAKAIEGLTTVEEVLNAVRS